MLNSTWGDYRGAEQGVYVNRTALSLDRDGEGNLTVTQLLRTAPSLTASACYPGEL